MATIGKHTRNFTVLFITSLGILGFMLFYLFGYIPENEKRINARNYRVLHRMGENISTSVVNYSGKVGSSYVSDAVKKIAVQIKPSQPPDFDGAILNKLREKAENKEATGKFGLQIFFEKKDDLTPSGHNQQDKVFHYLEEKGLVYLDFPSAINKITLKELEKNNIRLNEKTKKQEFHVKIPVDSLLSPLIRFDTFTHFIILRKEDASTMTGSGVGPDAKKGKPAGGNYEVLYNSRQNAELLPVDTLALLAHKSAGTRPADGFIAGVPYKIYALTQRVGSGEKWLLFGTLPAEKYEMESRAIPADVISFTALAFIILIMAFPFLKLILMNQQERLYARDVILSFLSLFVGLALVVLLLFDCYVFYGIDRSTEQQRLEILSGNLTENLTREISLVLNQLTLFNQCAADPANCKQEFNNYWRQVNTQEITRMSEKYFPNFQRIFQTDSAGMMTHSWKLNRNPNQNNAKVSVNTRNYFKIINNGGGYTLPDNPVKFALESITSFTDGEKYAVISTRSNEPVKGDKMPIIALATKLVTFYKPIFPPGYGFCVIDKEGEVLFHQNEDLNLNENLLEETNYDPRLKAALYGQTPAHFLQKYQGNQQQLYVTPLEGLPYFIVTYVNNAFNTGFNVNLLMLTAMFLSLYLFTIAIISSLLIFLNNGFSGVWFKWLWPQKNKLRSYAQITLAAAGTFFLVIWCTSTSYPISSFFCFIFAAIYILIFILGSLNHKSFLQVLYRSALILIILNIISLTPGSNVFTRTFLFQVLVIAFLWSMEALFRKRALIQFFSSNKIIQTFFPPQKQDVRLYGIMMGSWLLLTSGLPAFTLFRVAYNYEADLMVRYNQMHLAQALKNAYNSGSNSVGTPDSLKLITQTRFSYTHFFHHTQGSVTEAPSQITPEPPTKENLAKDIGPATQVVQNTFLTTGVDNLLAFVTNEADKLEENIFLNSFISFFRPIFRNVLSDEYYLKSNEVNYWDYSADNHNLLFSNQNQNNPIQLTSHLPKFKVPFLFYPVIGPAPGEEKPNLLSRINISAWFFWADMVLLVALLCLLIAFLVNRLFNADLISQVQRNRLDLSIIHPRNKINIFLISLPHTPDLKNLIQSGTNGYTVVFEEIDLEVYKNPGTGEEVKPLILEAVESLRTKIKSEILIKKLFLQREQVASYFMVKNFDYDPFSPSSLQIKNFLLQEVGHLGSSKIILQSKWHPDCWEKRLSAEEAKAGANADYKYLLQNFLAQLSDFIKVYQPLQGLPPAKNSAKVEEAITTEPSNEREAVIAPDGMEALKLLITQECSAASYLEKHFAGILQDYLVHYSGVVPLKPENIIYRLQSLAQLYYRSLWDACSEEEHYFLYDMAQDGLVNTKNIKVLSSLLGKGLMVVGSDGLLKIMNESFRGFILNTVNPLEALRFERSKAHASSWEVYRTPLVILLIGAVLFFFFTQKNSWANIIAILTAVSSFVSLLPRLSFLIPTFLVSKEAKPSE